jgi:hypothetical protein
MDKEKGSWRESVDGALAKTSSAPAETQFGTVTPEKLAAPSASLADEVTAAAGCRTDGDGEAFRRAAQLATWEARLPGRLPQARGRSLGLNELPACRGRTART